MEIKLLNIGYLPGADVVTVSLAAYDSAGHMHPIQAQWPAGDVSELDTLVRKAVEQVGGDLALRVDDANVKLAAEPVTTVSAGVLVDTGKDAALRAAVDTRKQELLVERARLAALAEAERIAATEALTREPA